MSTTAPTAADRYRINIKRVKDALDKQESLWFTPYQYRNPWQTTKWHILDHRNKSSGGKTYRWEALCGYTRYYNEDNFRLPRISTQVHRNLPTLLCLQCLQMQNLTTES